MKKEKIRELAKQEELENLELKLQAIYQPTRPRQEYVSNLHYRLDQELLARSLEPQQGGLGYLVIAALSVVSGTFLIVVIVRRLLSYFSHVDHLTGQVEANPVDSISSLV